MPVLKRLLSVFFILFLVFSINLNGQGHRIEVTLEGLFPDTLILGEYFTSRMITKDTIVLDGNGYGVFEGAEPYQGGLYLVYLSPGKHFDFLLGDDQVFSIKADTSELAGGVIFEGSEDNSVFQEYRSMQLRSPMLIKDMDFV